MRSSRLVALVSLASLAMVLTLACSKPKSFIVLTLRSAELTPITGVTAVVVTVKQGTSLSMTLTYPPKDGQPLTLDQSDTNDLSVSFAGARSGAVDLTVSAKNAAGCTIGFLSLSVPIRQGGVTPVTVDLAPQNDCSAVDGGVDVDGGGGGGDVFPGCNPVTPACMINGDTCQVNCTTHSGQCTPGGKGAPGTICTANSDCAPGSQCFDYSTTGCAVAVCLRFCDDAHGCSARAADAGVAADAGGSDGGGAASAAGTQSVCEGVVSCDGKATAYHTCTFACDPRASAVTAHTSGCPTGLSCLVVGNMDQVDCACPGSSLKGKDGDPCVMGGAQCGPGFVCNMMGGDSTCRAVCRCDATGMTCTAPNSECGDKVCSALTNDTTFGVCL